MKKLYVSIATALACGMISFGGINVNAQKLNKQFKLSDKAFVQKQKKVRTAMPQIMKSVMYEPQPQKEEIYTFDGNDWHINSSSEMTYDEFNKLLTKKSTIHDADGGVSFMLHDVFVYNENGYEIEDITKSSFDNGETWNLDGRKIADYDKIRIDVPVLFEFYMWDNSSEEWYLDEENEDGFFLEIERDEKNRVVKNTRWLNSTKPIALASHEFVYGEEGPVTGMKWNALNENYELTPAYIYENMDWAKTDDQLISVAPNIFYPFEIDSNNVLQGYTLYASNADGTKGNLVANYLAAYDDKDRLFYVSLNMFDGSVYQCIYSYDRDENGSFEMNEILQSDLNGDGEMSQDEMEMMRMYTTVDSYGQIIKEEMFMVDPVTNELTQTEGYIYDLEYDENGLILSETDSYYTDYVDNGSYVYLGKRIYSDYTTVSTGIEKVNKGNAEVSINGNSMNFRNARGAHYTICDLQGKTYGHGIVRNDVVAVDNLPEGMYIVKISGKNVNNAIKLIKK